MGFAAFTLLGVGIATTFVHKPAVVPHAAEAHFTKAAVAEKPPFTVDPTWPENVAASAIGAKGYGVLAAHGDQQPRPIASIAKVITCLAILEKHPLKPGEQGPSIPITAKDEEIYHNYVNQNGSVAFVQAGESLTERQAIEAMLLPSANNVADTAATWAFGSLDKYQAYANKMLERIKLTDTTVGSDASGLNPSTKSTVRDLVALGDVALQNPVLAEVVAEQQTSDLPASGSLPNYNRLVTHHGGNGIKIGDSDEAGITLLLSTSTTFNDHPVTLIGAVLGADRSSSPQENAFRFLESAKQSLK